MVSSLVRVSSHQVSVDLIEAKMVTDLTLSMEHDSDLDIYSAKYSYETVLTDKHPVCVNAPMLFPLYSPVYNAPVYVCGSYCCFSLVSKTYSVASIVANRTFTYRRVIRYTSMDISREHCYTGRVDCHWCCGNILYHLISAKLCQALVYYELIRLQFNM